MDLGQMICGRPTREKESVFTKRVPSGEGKIEVTGISNMPNRKAYPFTISGQRTRDLCVSLQSGQAIVATVFGLEGNLFKKDFEQPLSRRWPRSHAPRGRCPRTPGIF
jgi:hypothetical protein